jgi:hypothetical protein
MLEEKMTGLENDLSGLYDNFINLDQESDFENLEKKNIKTRRNNQKKY